MPEHVLIRTKRALGRTCLEQLQVVQGIAAREVCDPDTGKLLPGREPIRYFLPSTVWAEVAREVGEVHRDRWEHDHPGEPVPRLTRGNFNVLKLGALTVLNALTDDDSVVDWLNEPEARKCRFALWKERMVSGNPTFRPAWVAPPPPGVN